MKKISEYVVYWLIIASLIIGSNIFSSIFFPLLTSRDKVRFDSYVSLGLFFCGLVIYVLFKKKFKK